MRTSIRISLALASFVPEEINITAGQNVLTVEGRKAARRLISISIRAFPPAPSVGCSTWPITSR